MLRQLKAVRESYIREVLGGGSARQEQVIGARHARALAFRAQSGSPPHPVPTGRRLDRGGHGRRFHGQVVAFCRSPDGRGRERARAKRCERSCGPALWARPRPSSALLVMS